MSSVLLEGERKEQKSELTLEAAPNGVGQSPLHSMQETSHKDSTRPIFGQKLPRHSKSPTAPAISDCRMGDVLSTPGGTLLDAI